MNPSRRNEYYYFNISYTIKRDSTQYAHSSLDPSLTTRHCNLSSYYKYYHEWKGNKEMQELMALLSMLTLLREDVAWACAIAVHIVRIYVRVQDNTHPQGVIPIFYRLDACTHHKQTCTSHLARRCFFRKPRMCTTWSVSDDDLFVYADGGAVGQNARDVNKHFPYSLRVVVSVVIGWPKISNSILLDGPLFLHIVIM